MLLSLGLGLLPVAAAQAKERHFEQLRVLLITKTARCTSCHVDAKGEGLNAYGSRLAGESKDLPFAERIARVESNKSDGPIQATPSETRRDGDVDGDGVPNWVEILAHANPGDVKDRPDPATVGRITKVISCKICHTANNLPGEGLAANPHNELGRLLAATVDRKKPGRAPAGQAERRAAAERTPILRRLSIIKNKGPGIGGASYWQRLRLLHAPVDPADRVTPGELKAFKLQLSRQRRAKTRDPELGFDCAAHHPDGFLLDAEGLE